MDVVGGKGVCATLFSLLLCLLFDIIGFIYDLLHTIGAAAVLGSLPPPAQLASVTTTTPSETLTFSSITTPQVLPPQLSSIPPPSLQQYQGSSLLQSQSPIYDPTLLQPPLSGLILSAALEPIPQRLVQRILAGHFVERCDLLSDNIVLHDQLEAIQGQVNITNVPPSLCPRQREVPSLISWVYCFVAYIAVCSSDTLCRDMLAYCRILIREALRHGGTGWQEYDRNFRRQIEIHPTICWNSLRPDLQATTILSQRTENRVVCSLGRLH